MSNVNTIRVCAVCGDRAPCVIDDRALPRCETCCDDVEAGVSNRCDDCDGPAPPGSDVCVWCHPDAEDDAEAHDGEGW